MRTVTLAARNRLAEIILAARHDPAARRELTALADDGARSRNWLEDEARDGAVLRARARRAAEAWSGRPLGGDDDRLEVVLEDAARLFDAGLFFEVHELLESHWHEAAGELREALQGLIQIAVGYQHLDNGNVPGARSLLAEGAQRIEARVVAGVGLGHFARMVRAALERLGSASIPPFPRQS